MLTDIDLSTHTHTIMRAMAKNISCREGETLFRTKLHHTDTTTIRDLESAVGRFCGLICSRGGCEARRDLESAKAGVRRYVVYSADSVVHAIDRSKQD